METSNKHSLLKAAYGFTLVEVMISITILMFISFATYKMVDTNVDTKERVVKEDRQTIQSLVAIGRLDSDISQIYNPLYSSGKMVPTASGGNDVYADNSPSANGVFDGKTISGALIPQFISEDKSTMAFLTLANRRKIADTKESRFAWVKYSLRPMEPDPDNPDDQTSGLNELVRQTITTDIFNPTQDWSKSKFQVVMEKIKSLEFSFWDERTKKFTTSIQELNENKNLIRSLKVSIVWIDDDKNEQKIEKTFRALFPYFNTKQDEKTDGKSGSSGSGSFMGTGIDDSEAGVDNEED